MDDTRSDTFIQVGAVAVPLWSNWETGKILIVTKCNRRTSGPGMMTNITRIMYKLLHLKL